MSDIIVSEQLLDDIDSAIKNWNEHASFKLAGINNLSMSDIDTLILYTERYLEVGSFDGLMPPLGNIKKVLDKYGLIEKGGLS